MKLNIVKCLGALAHDSRLAIFKALVQAGPSGLAAGKIGETVGLAPPSVSFHMKELTHADMVISRNEGRFVIYTANFDSMNSLVSFLTENCCGGEQCLPAMQHQPAKKRK